MKNYDRVLDGWEVGRTRTALLGIILGLAGATAIAALGTAVGAGNQAAAAIVAAASLSGCSACVTHLLHSEAGRTARRAVVADQARATRLARATKLDIFNIRSTNA